MDEIQANLTSPSIAVVGVKFRDIGTVYRFDTGGLLLNPGDRVLAPADRGIGLGTVVGPTTRIDKPAQPLPRVVRPADPRDLAREESNLQRARDAERLCARRVRELGMPMKVVRSECLYDASKITLYFYSDERIDFRDLVRNLAQALHTRIEMQQISPRDETKLMGGLGPCGRELCCSSWMREPPVVSVKMAKEQGLSLNPSKLAGMCGKLKCCLRFEYETYQSLGRALPAVGSQVESIHGTGTVSRQNPLRQTIMIRIETGVEIEATLETLVLKKGDDAR